MFNQAFANITIFAVAILSSSLALAQEATAKRTWQDKAALWRWQDATPLERQAYSCVAMFHIFAGAIQTPGHEELVKFAMIGQQILKPVAAQQTVKRLSENITNGYISAVRDKEMKVLGVTYEYDKGKAEALAWECVSWITAIKEDIENEKLKDFSQIGLPVSTPPIGAKRQEIQNWISAAFQAWKNRGSMVSTDEEEYFSRGSSK